MQEMLKAIIMNYASMHEVNKCMESKIAADAQVHGQDTMKAAVIQILTT